MTETKLKFHINEINEIEHNWTKILIQYCLIWCHSAYNCRMWYKDAISHYSVEFCLIMLKCLYIFIRNLFKMGGK
jgi:hypothetical protein